MYVFTFGLDPDTLRVRNAVNKKRRVMARKGIEKTRDLGNGRTPDAPTGNGANGASSLEITPGDISARAYEIYVREGRIDGKDMDHWLRAEAELRAERQKSERTEKPERSGSRQTAAPAASPRPAQRVQPEAALV
jgi:hypothetical protein